MLPAKAFPPLPGGWACQCGARNAYPEDTCGTCGGSRWPWWPASPAQRRRIYPTRRSQAGKSWFSVFGTGLLENGVYSVSALERVLAPLGGWRFLEDPSFRGVIQGFTAEGPALRRLREGGGGVDGMTKVFFE